MWPARSLLTTAYWRSWLAAVGCVIPRPRLSRVSWQLRSPGSVRLWTDGLVQGRLNPLFRTSRAALGSRMICGGPADLGNHQVLAIFRISDFRP